MENYVGKRLDGRYEIIEIIGVGGMAVVYKAFDNIDHKIVAVKILKDEFLANEEFRRRFKNESKAIALLSHHNIVKVFDVSYGDVIQYIVMEYVDGITLKEYMLQQGKIDPREAIYFMTQILRALQHAHDKGIVHRDIKPQNIMLQADGSIKVTDFGIARFSRSETRTMTDGAIGSVHYISPEQAKGSITDAKTDLYSVGVVLYEMLTGRLPFQSDNAVSVALMQLQNDPEKPRSINPDIPIGLEQIIIRAMQKNQSDRYQSASEVLLDLNAYKKNPNIKFDYAYDDEEKPLPTKTAPEYFGSLSTTQKQSDDENEIYYDEIAVGKNNKGKKVTITILTAVLIALIIFAWTLLSVFSSSSNKIEVPSFIGLNYSEAKELYQSSFELVPEYRYSADYQNDLIFWQSISAGNKIVKGEKITVYVSGTNSDEGIKIPDADELRNLGPYAAEIKLKNLGFAVEIVTEFNDSEPDETFLRTEPEGGTYAAIGSVVTIYYSTDEQSFVVPNVIGKQRSVAYTELSNKGLLVVIEEQDDKRPKGLVIGQSPIEEEVFPGDTITLFVSTGKDPQEVEIPDLSGKLLSEAEKTLDDLGFEVVVEVQDSDLPANTVISVVDAGKKVTPSKTVVTIIVSSGNSPETTEPSTEPSTTVRDTTLPSQTTTEATKPAVTTTEPITTEPTTTEPVSTTETVTTTQPTTENVTTTENIEVTTAAITQE